MWNKNIVVDNVDDVIIDDERQHLRKWLWLYDGDEVAIKQNIAKGTTDPGVDCFDQ